jgi:hypothetical protein
LAEILGRITALKGAGKNPDCYCMEKCNRIRTEALLGGAALSLLAVIGLGTGAGMILRC